MASHSTNETMEWELRAESWRSLKWIPLSMRGLCLSGEQHWRRRTAGIDIDIDIAMRHRKKATKCPDFICLCNGFAFNEFKAINIWQPVLAHWTVKSIASLNYRWPRPGHSQSEAEWRQNEWVREREGGRERGEESSWSNGLAMSSILITASTALSLLLMHMHSDGNNIYEI